jgi:hypothetical protein
VGLTDSVPGVKGNRRVPDCGRAVSAYVTWGIAGAFCSWQPLRPQVNGVESIVRYGAICLRIHVALAFGDLYV